LQWRQQALLHSGAAAFKDVEQVGQDVDLTLELVDALGEGGVLHAQLVALFLESIGSQVLDLGAELGHAIAGGFESPAFGLCRDAVSMAPLSQFQWHFSARSTPAEGA